MIERFVDLFEDCTKQGSKIKTDEYKEAGKYIIVDQGQNDIAGYTDEINGVYEDIPAIVFGDHTRVIKYIDKPFFLGADGVKLLKCKRKNANYKYLYYALKNAKIPNTGYNRHYKWLKEIRIMYPDLIQQQRIVDVLDKIEKIMLYRKKQIDKLDELIKARFVEMFGDPVSNTLGWDIVEVGDVCFVTKLAGFEYTEYIKYQDHGDVIMIRWLNVKEKKIKLDDVYYIDAKVSDMLPRSQLRENDIVMTYVGVNIGDVALVDGYNRYHLAPNVAKISLNSFEVLNPMFFVNLLAFNKENYASNATNTAKQALNMDKIRKLQVMLPPIDLQNQFEIFAKQVDKLKVAVQKSLDETQLLFDSLMQQYFG